MKKITINIDINRDVSVNANKTYRLNPDFMYPWITIEISEDILNIKYFKLEITKCKNLIDKDFFCKSPDEINEKISYLYV
jgi:hypothetical protein